MSQNIHLISGRMGVTDGFYSPANAITEDNDGEFTGYFGLIDLTYILSNKLGKQLSQMANYRVSFVQIDLRNVNNAVDNDASLTAGGVIRWVAPTKHRINALQYCREYKQNLGHSIVTQGDQFAPWDDDNRYRGIRFNWSADSQLGSTGTTDDTTALSGTYFDFATVFEEYNQIIQGTPAQQGRPTSGEGEAMWSSRTGHDLDANHDHALYWVTSYRNRFQHQEGATYTPSLVGDDAWIHGSDSRPYQLDLGNRHIQVLGGLLELDVVHTNTDTAGILEDEFYIQVTLGVEGWEEF